MENIEQELLLKQITRNLLKKNLEQVKGSKSDNKSFVYLENNTLDMLIVYLLMQLDTPNTNGTDNNSNNDFIHSKLHEELDSVITNNRKGFEEVLSMLKDET